MPELDTHQQNGIFLTITSFASSVASFVVAYLTKTNIAWTVGIVAGCISIYCGILTAIEKKKSIRKLDDEWNMALEAKKAPLK